MAQAGPFSHITVHADDDDIVIQAGVRSDAAVAFPDISESDASRPGADPEASRPAAEPAGSKPAREPVGPQPAADPEDDLAAPPMPLAQKVVIVAACVLIVGFAVYYCFIR